MASSVQKPGMTTLVQTRILMAAERLFCIHGIDAVSLREIAAAAGHGNNNAVQYHFGSKEGLVQAIFLRHLEELDVQRQQLLTRAEEEGRLRDARTLLNILCMPLLEQVDDEGRHTYAGFLAQYLIRHGVTDLRAASSEAWQKSPALCRTLDLLEERISYVPPELAQYRLSLAVLSFYTMLVRTDTQSLNRKAPPVFAQLVDDTLETITAGFCTPYRG